MESGLLFSARTNWKLRMPPIRPQMQQAEKRIIWRGGGNRRREEADRRGQSEERALPAPPEICGAGRSDERLVCLQLTSSSTREEQISRSGCRLFTH